MSGRPIQKHIAGNSHKFVILALAHYTTELRSAKEEMLSKGLCPNGLHAGAVARSVTASEGVEAGLGFSRRPNP